MHHWTKRLLVVAAAFSISSCLWGPGKFTSDLTLKRDVSFVLDYRGELVLQLPAGRRRGSAVDRRHGGLFGLRWEGYASNPVQQGATGQAKVRL